MQGNELDQPMAIRQLLYEPETTTAQKRDLETDTEAPAARRRLEEPAPAATLWCTSSGDYRLFNTFAWDGGSEGDTLYRTCYFTDIAYGNFDFNYHQDLFYPDTDLGYYQDDIDV